MGLLSVVLSSISLSRSPRILSKEFNGLKKRVLSQNLFSSHFFALQRLCLKPPYPAEHAPLLLHLQTVSPELLLTQDIAALQASSFALGDTPPSEKAKAFWLKMLCQGVLKLAATHPPAWGLLAVPLWPGGCSGCGCALPAHPVSGSV